MNDTSTQPLSIFISQSTGAGAGKITFNPVSIVKRMDSVSGCRFLHSF